MSRQNFLNKIKGWLDGYEVMPITKQNFGQAFEVYNTNQDFFILTQNKEATIESSIIDIDAIPPNCTMEQKIYVGIWQGGKITAVLDLIENFPEQGSFWIGLLLVHGSLHGKKIGSNIVNAVLNAAMSAGYKSVQLGVIENNAKGISFWQRHGFEIIRRSGNILIMASQIERD